MEEEEHQIATPEMGREVLEWLDSADAARQASRLARRRGLSGYDALAENLLADARVAVWRRMSSDKPLHVERPGAYGTAVLRSVVRGVAEGRDRVELPDDPDVFERIVAPAAAAAPGSKVSGLVSGAEDLDAVDETRLQLEHLGDDRSWVTSAALSYLVLLVDPDARPDGAPWPAAGATPDQARCWPALWFAGERTVFDDPLGAREAARIRRTRARRIDAVRTRLDRAFVQVRMRRGEQERSDQEHSDQEHSDQERSGTDG